MYRRTRLISFHPFPLEGAPSVPSCLSGFCWCHHPLGRQMLPKYLGRPIGGPSRGWWGKGLRPVEGTPGANPHQIT